MLHSVHNVCFITKHYQGSSDGKGKGAPIHATKAHRGNGSIRPLILNLGSGWKYLFYLTPWPPYPPEMKAGTHGTEG